MNQASPQATLISTLITFAVIGVVLFFRLRSMSKERPLKLGQLWIVPGIFLFIAGFLFWSHPPKGMTLMWCAAALAIGAVLGWQRGRMMHIAVDPETQTLRQKASLGSMLFLLGLIAVRTAAREAAAFNLGGLHVDTMAVTDVMLALAFGLISVQRIEMYIRAKRLLDQARPA
jgi:membrane protein CcdC involved in cytochrome C biogenesis